MNTTLNRRLDNVSDIAKTLGVSREWIWCVRTGRGTSARIEKALREAGIKVSRRKSHA